MCICSLGKEPTPFSFLIYSFFLFHTQVWLQADSTRNIDDLGCNFLTYRDSCPPCIIHPFCWLAVRSLSRRRTGASLCCWRCCCWHSSTLSCTCPPQRREPCWNRPSAATTPPLWLTDEMDRWTLYQWTNRTHSPRHYTLVNSGLESCQLHFLPFI